MERGRTTVVKVGGQKWKLVWSALDKDVFGECDSGDKVIRLNPSQPDSEVESTIFHELVHAALAIGGVNQLFTSEQEEAIAHCLENLLFPIYKRK